MLHNNRVKSYCLAKHEHLTHVRHMYLTRLFYSNHVSLQQKIIWKLGLLAISLKLFCTNIFRAENRSLIEISKWYFQLVTRKSSNLSVCSFSLCTTYFFRCQSYYDDFLFLTSSRFVFRRKTRCNP